MYIKIFVFTFFILGIVAYIFLGPFEFNKDVEKNSRSNIPLSELSYKVALFSDSHTSYDKLQKAVDVAKNHSVDYIIHTGDLSDFGETESYIKSKEVLDKSGIKYVVIAGDRDKVENGANFIKYFESKQCYDKLLKEYKIICLHNSFNYTKLSQEYIDTFINSLSNSDVVVSAQPIYNPNSNIYMGFYDDNVKEQSDVLYEAIESSNVKLVLSADAHFFSSYSGLPGSSITYYTLGALTSERNIQKPNFTLLSLYKEGEVFVEQIYVD